MKKYLTILVLIVFICFGIVYSFSTKPENMPVAKSEKAVLKTYTNQKYGYSFKYPNYLFAFEQSDKFKDQLNLVEEVSDKDFVQLSSLDLRKDFSITDGLWIRVSHENGEAFISDSKTVDDFWVKLTKNNTSDVNVLIKKETINGVDFIVFNQKNWDIASQSYIWSVQALFMNKGNFFWVSSSPQVKLEYFYSILKSLTFIN